MMLRDEPTTTRAGGYLARALGAAITLGVAATPGVAVAQGADWQKVWNDTVAAAKKEGSVACGCPRHPGSRKFLQTRWAKDYPEIKLDYTAAKLPEWPARVRAERKAGKFLWDVFFTGPGPEIYRLANDGILDPLVPNMILPEVKDPDVWGGWDAAFYDKDKSRMLSFWQNLSAPYYNAKLISPEEVAKKGLNVLFDPKYKGKTIWWDPRVGGSGSNYATFFTRKFGEDGLHKLLVDQEPVFVRSSTAMAERLVRGTMAISIGPQLDEPLQPFAKAGLKFDIRAFGNSKEETYASTSYGVASIFNRPAHANAAKVFINWLLSKETQIGLGKAAKQVSRRSDIARSPTALLKAKAGEDYLNLQREEYLPIKRKAMKLARKLRPQ